MEARKRAKKGDGRSSRVLQNGWAIREIRQLKKLSGSGLAARIGITPGTLCNIEAERRSASPRMLGRISHALGVPIHAIARDHILPGPGAYRPRSRRSAGASAKKRDTPPPSKEDDQAA